jgi:hypothetical protein
MSTKKNDPWQFDEILHALQEKKVFIGIYMLCRYLNGKGYIRYGCNAKYRDGIKGKKTIKNYPCNRLCSPKKWYYSKVRYWLYKMENMGLIYLEKLSYGDSVNPDIKFYRRKFRSDIFLFITMTKKRLKSFLKRHPTNYMSGMGEIEEKGGGTD